MTRVSSDRRHCKDNVNNARKRRRRKKEEEERHKKEGGLSLRCPVGPAWPSGKTLGWQTDDVGSIPRFGCPSFLFEHCGLWTLSCETSPHN